MQQHYNITYIKTHCLYTEIAKMIIKTVLRSLHSELTRDAIHLAVKP